MPKITTLYAVWLDEISNDNRIPMIWDGGKFVEVKKCSQ